MTSREEKLESTVWNLLLGECCELCEASDRAVTTWARLQGQVRPWTLRWPAVRPRHCGEHRYHQKKKTNSLSFLPGTQSQLVIFHSYDSRNTARLCKHVQLPVGFILFFGLLFCFFTCRLFIVVLKAKKNLRNKITNLDNNRTTVTKRW